MSFPGQVWSTSDPSWSSSANRFKFRAKFVRSRPKYGRDRAKLRRDCPKFGRGQVWPIWAMYRAKPVWSKVWPSLAESWSRGVADIGPSSVNSDPSSGVYACTGKNCAAPPEAQRGATNRWAAVGGCGKRRPVWAALGQSASVRRARPSSGNVCNAGAATRTGGANPQGTMPAETRHGGKATAASGRRKLCGRQPKAGVGAQWAVPRGVPERAGGISADAACGGRNQAFRIGPNRIGDEGGHEGSGEEGLGSRGLGRIPRKFGRVGRGFDPTRTSPDSAPARPSLSDVDRIWPKPCSGQVRALRFTPEVGGVGPPWIPQRGSRVPCSCHA